MKLEDAIHDIRAQRITRLGRGKVDAHVARNKIAEGQTQLHYAH